VYDGTGYEDSIYAEKPVPRLAPDDAAWAAQLVPNGASSEWSVCPGDRPAWAAHSSRHTPCAVRKNGTRGVPTTLTPPPGVGRQLGW